MVLVPAKDMLVKARKEGYAVGHFNINNLEWTKAILAACEEAKSPVILGVSEGAAKYMTGFRTVAAMVEAMVEEMKITVPVALHLDHGSYEGTKAAIEAGFSSVMFDGSHYPFEENIEKSKEMIANKDVKRKYYALVHGSIKHDYGTIDAPIARNPKERKEMAIIDEGKPSITHFKVIERFEKYTLIECELETGRTHQIRVHMKYINHPLVGDPVYGPRKTLNANGQALHSKSIEFNHPITGKHVYFETPIPQYMLDIMAKLDK